MEKRLKKYFIVCMTLLFCFVGCVQNTPNEDEAELILNNTVNRGEAEWRSNCEILVSALTEVAWIAKVEILPDSYEAYLKEKKFIIRITAIEGLKVTGQDREHISDYVKNSGCAEQFDIEYVQ